VIDMETLARRLDTVEAALAHQELTVADLDRVVVDQWRLIDELQRRVGLLTDQLREAESRFSRSGAPEPPPPHY
jgi:SlyX protein